MSMNYSTAKKLLPLLFLSALSNGCATNDASNYAYDEEVHSDYEFESNSDISNPNQPIIKNKENLTVNTSPQQLIHAKVISLGNSLLSSANVIDLEKGVAVGTFLPLDYSTKRISGNSMPASAQNNLFGYQLQESFVTVATQAGLKVIEFKTTNAIKFDNQQDVMLSRQLSDLTANINANYFLTGTYAEQENSFVINARLIDVASQQVIAAATDYMPLNIMAEQHKTTLKSNLLYRKGY